MEYLRRLSHQLIELRRIHLHELPYQPGNEQSAQRYSDWAAHLSDRAFSNAGDKPGTVADGSAVGQRWSNDAILTAEKKFGDFNLRLIAGATSRETFSKNIDISAGALQIDDFYNIKNRIGELTRFARQNSSRIRI